MIFQVRRELEARRIARFTIVTNSKSAEPCALRIKSNADSISVSGAGNVSMVQTGPVSANGDGLAMVTPHFKQRPPA